MKKAALLLLIFGVIWYGCSPSSYPKATDVQRIEVRLDSSKGSNFGSLIPINFIAHTGRKGSLSVNHKIVFKNPAISFYQNSIQLHINIDPTEYQDSIFNIVYQYQESPTWDSFALDIHYDKNIYVNLNGIREQEKQRKQTLLGSLINISAGSHGKDGKNGADGKNARIHIWKDSSTSIYSIYVRSEDSSYNRFFISTIPVPLRIESIGGNGQDGEDGKSGRNGRAGNDNTMGGDGKSGGNGGNAGSGGNGGILNIYIHPSAIEFKDLITTKVSGGNPGSAGDGGSGGRGGNGNPDGINGLKGMDGMKGFKGFSGPEPYILIDSFNINSILGN